MSELYPVDKAEDLRSKIKNNYFLAGVFAVEACFATAYTVPHLQEGHLSPLESGVIGWSTALNAAGIGVNVFLAYQRRAELATLEQGLQSHP